MGWNDRMASDEFSGREAQDQREGLGIYSRAPTYELVNQATVARRLGVSRQVVERWRKVPSFPAPVSSPDGPPVFVFEAVRGWREQMLDRR